MNVCFKCVYLSIVLCNRWGGGELKGNTVLNFNKVCSWKFWYFCFLHFCKLCKLFWDVLFLLNSVNILTSNLIFWYHFIRWQLKSECVYALKDGKEERGARESYNFESWWYFKCTLFQIYVAYKLHVMLHAESNSLQPNGQ